MDLIGINEEIEKRLEAISWTPLHTRLLAHRIGDGSCNHYGHYVYDNKNMNEFVELLNFLKIKYWGPVVSDKYGTYKVIIPKKTFKDFASIFQVNHEELIRNPLILLDIVSKLSEDHQLQAILAFIVDDGSCRNWRITVFEDRNEQVFVKVKSLWESLFNGTSSDWIYVTKSGTKIYHLFAKREGIISLAKGIKEAVEKYGILSNLWWKQKDFDERYEIAISKRAIELFETKVGNDIRNKLVLSYLQENKYATFTELQNILNLTRDRTYLVLLKLIGEKKIFLIKASKKSRYSLNIP